MKTFVKDVMNVIFYCDGQHDLIDLSNRLKISFDKCQEYVILLKNNGVIRRAE